MRPSQSTQTIAKKILEFIKQHDHFLLSAHINSDGDAIASMIAMRLLLLRLNKHSIMVLQDQKIDPKFDYLKDFDLIHSYDESRDFGALLPSGRIEAAIILDVPGYGRLGEVRKLLPAKDAVVKIDHHPVEDVMGVIDWADEQASSTTAMIYEILEVGGIEPDVELAKALFTGIVYDTGRFSFSNTRARDFYIAGKTVTAGVEPAEITKRIFFENSFTALKTIGKGLSSLERYLDGQVIVIYLNQNDLLNNDQSEIEELANYTVAVRGGKVGLFIREIKPKFHKISLRSKSHVDVNQVAKAFNGGGHTRAAGCRIEGTKKQVIEMLVKEIARQLK